MNPIPIFIPVVNRLDLLRKAIASIPLDDRWQVEVINNTGSLLPDDIAAGDCNPDYPLTATQSLNWMQNLAKTAWNEPFYFFMHNDAEAGDGTMEKLFQATVELHAREKWGVIFTNYDALAAFNVEAFDAVGGWDENFKGYFSDNDVYRRLRMAGYPTFEAGFPVEHLGSQTIHSDPERQRQNSIDFPAAALYYEKKWGGSPGNETFDIPFGGSNAE